MESIYNSVFCPIFQPRANYQSYKHQVNSRFHKTPSEFILNTSMLLPGNHKNRHRRSRASNHMLWMERAYQHIIGKTWHYPNDIRNLACKPIKARCRSGQKVWQNDIALLTMCSGIYVFSSQRSEICGQTKVIN